MATRKTAATKTQQDWESDVEKLQRQLDEAKKRVAVSKISDALKSTNILEEFQKLKAKLDKVSDVELLIALGDALGIKRLSVKQTPPIPRKSATKTKSQATKKTKTSAT